MTEKTVKRRLDAACNQALVAHFQEQHAKSEVGAIKFALSRISAVADAAAVTSASLRRYAEQHTIHDLEDELRVVNATKAYAARTFPYKTGKGQAAFRSFLRSIGCRWRAADDVTQGEDDGTESRCAKRGRAPSSEVGCKRRCRPPEHTELDGHNEHEELEDHDVALVIKRPQRVVHDGRLLVYDRATHKVYAGEFYDDAPHARRATFAPPRTWSPSSFVPQEYLGQWLVPAAMSAAWSPHEILPLSEELGPWEDSYPMLAAGGAE